MFRWTFPRRQQYRRLRRAGVSGVAGVTAGLMAALAASVGAIRIAGVLLLIMVGLMSRRSPLGRSGPPQPYRRAVRG